MVHEREDQFTCGPIMPQGGIQALETMLYTIDHINKHQNWIPGVTLGAHILDDCDKDTYGLEQAVDFIKGKKDSPSYKYSAQFACNVFVIELTADSRHHTAPNIIQNN